MYFFNDLIEGVSERGAGETMKVGSYDYDGLAHFWVHYYGAKSTAKDRYGYPRMSANGNVILSYSTEIATIVDNDSHYSGKLILMTDRKYSSTTQKQKSAIRYAADCPVVEVAHIEPSNIHEHTDNIIRWMQEFKEAKLKMSRARKESSRDSWKRRLDNIAYELEVYGNAFSLREFEVFVEALAYVNGVVGDDAFEKIDNSIEERKEQQRKEERKRKQKRTKEAQKALEKWKNGEDVHNQLFRILDVKLRVKGNYVETSHGVSVELRHAQTAVSMYKKGKIKQGVHIDVFDVRNVSDDSITIGCHVIKKDEIDRVADEILNAKVEKIPSLDELHSQIETNINNLMELTGELA